VSLNWQVALEQLEARLKQHPGIGLELQKAHDGDLFFPDLWAIAALNRSMSVLRGFSQSIKDNYLSAAHLVRLHLDSFLRFSAVFLVADPTEFIRRVMGGEQFNKIQSAEGKQMRDSYLVDKLEAYYPGLRQIYDYGCGYVHLSDTHVFHCLEAAVGGGIQISIGCTDERVTDDMRLNAIETMIFITDRLLDEVRRYTAEKSRFPKAPAS